MRHATLQELLTSTEALIPDYYLYLVEAEGCVLYVGQSINPLQRLIEHIGLVQGRSASSLGERILANLPSSLSWSVTLLTLADCRPYVTKHFKQYAQGESKNTTRAINAAEVALISHFKPCLNSMHCLETTSLPLTITNEPVRLEEALIVLQSLLKGQRVPTLQHIYLREQMNEEVNKYGL